MFRNNKEWAKEALESDAEFFSRWENVQEPKIFWIGCADSRVPPNIITKTQPGDLFVHRNVANVVSPSDISIVSAVHFAIHYLKVKDIIVGGHYGCGGVRASLAKNDFGPMEPWLANIRQLRSIHQDKLTGDANENEKTLIDLNVETQVYNVARIPSVQQAWKNGQELRIHGVVYDLSNGRLNEIISGVDSIDDIPDESVIIQ